MAIKQLTVFIQNQRGTVVSVTEILSNNNINLRALSIAETQDFGILRLIVNDDAAAEKALAGAMKTMLGINPTVHLVAPKSIARSEGKAVRVIDKRKLV